MTSREFGKVEPRKLRLARYGDRCPDPKEFGCAGELKYVSQLVGPSAKHPDWLMCERCKSLFDEEGKWAHWSSWGKDPLEPIWIQPPKSDSASQPRHGFSPRQDGEFIPW